MNNIQSPTADILFVCGNCTKRRPHNVPGRFFLNRKTVPLGHSFCKNKNLRCCLWWGTCKSENWSYINMETVQ